MVLIIVHKVLKQKAQIQPANCCRAPLAFLWRLDQAGEDKI
jgi:hypothetical protein